MPDCKMHYPHSPLDARAAHMGDLPGGKLAYRELMASARNAARARAIRNQWKQQAPIIVRVWRAITRRDDDRL